MLREEFFGSEILRSNRGACLRVPSPGSPPRSGIECREARFCHPMKRARWGLRQTARSCSIGLDTPGWTTLSTNATCQQEKTENSAWNLVGRVPRDDSRTNAVARRGAVPNQPDVSAKCSRYEASSGAARCCEQTGQESSKLQGWLPGNAVFQLGPHEIESTTVRKPVTILHRLKPLLLLRGQFWLRVHRSPCDSLMKKPPAGQGPQPSARFATPDLGGPLKHYHSILFFRGAAFRVALRAESVKESPGNPRCFCQLRSPLPLEAKFCSLYGTTFADILWLQRSDCP